ncbi:MAG TPA: class II aldolase/adducin family protein [Draconibacterium sp.]|nr:class II aldolase/adducin family protein [Draconibacterium sp.]
MQTAGELHGEGYLKFHCTREDKHIHIPEQAFDALSKWRQNMFNSGLIGMNLEGIGYGNLSVRATDSSFYISGTATGRLPVLEEKHFALVNSWSFSENSLLCSGLINASAESLSHAAIYETLANVGSVIHIHHKGMWDKYFALLLTTSPEILYGTPEMAYEIKKIIATIKPEQDNILIMGGHEEGIIAWGETPDDAGENILKYYKVFLEEG